MTINCSQIKQVFFPIGRIMTKRQMKYISFLLLALADYLHGTAFFSLPIELQLQQRIITPVRRNGSNLAAAWKYVSHEDRQTNRQTLFDFLQQSMLWIMEQQQEKPQRWSKLYTIEFIYQKLLDIYRINIRQAS